MGSGMNEADTGVPEGYVTDAGLDPAEDHTGPFYYRRTEDGFVFAFRAAPHNCNLVGLVHGGVLMSFADFALCMEATDGYVEEQCVTVSFNCEFMAEARVGDLVQARSEKLRKTRSLVFVRGEIYCGDRRLMAFSAIVKRLPKD